ncbi:UPF0764 protein C16orf89 homolog isoform X2 [Leptinotarsa decemlineata]|uniref:UPF0764 protein C16orf89 homolog isoform X2 n=1 Tax=Leptinotarsa decemlineata TaxID=7539 RepID=UPI003D309D67
MKFLFVISLFLVPYKSIQISLDDLRFRLRRTIDFFEEKYTQFGFDGAFGLTLAEVQNSLLNPKRWSDTLKNVFTEGNIEILGIYKNWTVQKILQQKKAVYKGVKSDRCLVEILNMSAFNGYCYISNICSEMMLDVFRIDTGYLLTHRLLYLQIQRLQGCKIPDEYRSTSFNDYTEKFCSYIYKEAKTNEYLGYPYHDIFMEQVVLCGMEGYSEFISEEWISEVIRWQNPHGCYESIAKNKSKRTSTLIDYGCSDHSTGLGAAALALYYRYFHNTSFQNHYNTLYSK